jgi:hypothetical protein
VEDALSIAEQIGEWSGENTSVVEIERQLAALRLESDTEGAPQLRTSVLTHIAWVPPEWERQAFDTLAGLAERHPSRTIVLVPDPDAASDAIDANVSLRCFALPGAEREVCSEVIELRLRGRRGIAPASIVAPLLIADLPVFLRWRGRPPYGEGPFEQMIDLADRLVVDSTEWPDLPSDYAGLLERFDRIAASDIAWARTSRWRAMLASLWPDIADVQRIRVRGTLAQANLLAGWLRSRLGRRVALEHEPAERLEGVDVDGEPAPFPPGDAPHPSDLLSDELETYERDRVYEGAVRATLD